MESKKIKLLILITEYGGIVMGWSGIVSNSLYIIFSTLLLVFGGALIAKSIEDHKSKQSNLEDTFENNSTLWNNSTLVNNSTIGTSVTTDEKTIADALGFGIAMLVFFIVLGYAILFLRLWASISLLYGTKKVS